MKKLNYFGLFVLVFLLSCCKQNKPDEPTSNFEIKTMLSSHYESIILPSFEEMAISTLSLKSATDNFISFDSQTNLDALRSSFKTAYINWQSCAPFSFGPTDMLDEKINIFPTDISTLEDYITTPSSATNKADTRGFPALDYLLFHTDDAALIDEFKSQSRKDYLTSLIEEVNSSYQKALIDWRAYKTTFTGSADLVPSSPIGLLFNNFHNEFDYYFKRLKLVIPAGREVGQTTTLPKNLEGYYSGITKQLLDASASILDQIYFGKSRAAGNIGFDDWLISKEKKELLTRTTTQWDLVLQKLNVLPSEISGSLESQQMKELIDESIRHVRFFKTDLSSATGIQIDIFTSDGD